MSTSPVKCSHFTLGNPKKSFSTALFIHTSDYLPYHRRNTQLFNSLLSKTTWIGRYQMKQSPRHTLPDHQTSFINFLHLVWSTASSLFSLCACQSFSTTSVRVLFGLSLGLEPSTSYSIHFFTQPSSSFHSTCPCHCSLFCRNTNAVSSIPNLSLSALYLEICLLA